MIRAMLQDVHSGSARPERRIAHRAGVWEVAGILAAVVPCGILAGLYLATADVRFILGCAVLAVLAVAIILLRNPDSLRLARLWPLARRRAEGAEPAQDGLATRLGRTFSTPLLKIVCLAAWLMAWAVTAALYTRISPDVNIGALVLYVAIGGFSPVVIYFGLETGVKKLGDRLRHDK